MPREIDASVITALGNEHLRWIALVELIFDAVTVRFCSRLSSFTHGGNTYTGLGSVGSISSTSENNSLDPTNCTIEISAIDPSVLATFANNDHINRKAKVYYALLTENDAIIGDPILFFDGSMDEMEITYGKVSRISIKLKDRLADWDRAQSERWSHEEQQAIYSGDNGFIYAAQMDNMVLNWPGTRWRP